MGVKVVFISAVVVIIIGACVFVLPKMGNGKIWCVRKSKQAVQTEQIACKEVGMGDVAKSTKDVKSVSWLHVTSRADEALKEVCARADEDMQLAIVIQGFG